jgi:hypothetical protein
LESPNWQVTATNIYCEAVDDNVTILVYKDYKTKCTGYTKYVESLSPETAKEMNARSRKLARKLKCEGPLDARVTAYRDKIKQEESKSK